MSAASEYAELLKLIEISGPFISLPVFKEVFPQGFAKDSPDQIRELRIENKRHFLEVPGDIVEKVDPIFFADPLTAAIKALGMS
jgi:hypothetical protein